MTRPTTAPLLLAVALLAAPARADDDAPATAPTTMPATTTTTQANLPSAQEVLDRYVEATGGRAGYEAIRDAKTTGTLAMKEMGLAGTLAVAQSADGRARVTVDIAGIGKTEQGISPGGVAWSTDAMQGPRLLEGPERDELARTFLLDSAITLRDYAEARVVGVELVEGEPAYRMELVGKAGQPETRFYAVDGGLLVRTTRRATSPVGEFTVTTTYDEYRDTPPVQTPTRFTQVMEGVGQRLRMEFAMADVRYNVGLPDEAFAPPPDVRALIEAVPTTQPR